MQNKIRQKQWMNWVRTSIKNKESLYRFLYRIRDFVLACMYSTAWMPYVRTRFRQRWIYYFFGVLSIPVGFINYIISPAMNRLPPKGLAVVAIVKNEGRYIQEWIEFYLLSGVDKIILYDNGSTDQTAELIKNNGGGYVDYHFLPGEVRQLDAYNAALHQYCKQYRYMAFLDCDEFLYSERSLYDVIDELFSNHGDMGGIGVNWLSFGSSGHRARPSGSVIENYLWRAEVDFPVNRLIKTVAIPTRVLAYVSPHYPLYRRGYKEYGENGRKLKGSMSEIVSTNTIRINHYFTKSWEDWIEKVNRGRADIYAFRNKEEFEYRDRNEVFDDRLLEVARKLKLKELHGNS